MIDLPFHLFCQQIGSSAGPRLGDLAPGGLRRGADPGPGGAFLLGRAERDRLVIFDPRCAPLLRPAIGPGDMGPWHAAATAWLLAIPAGHTAALLGAELPAAAAWAGLAARYPALARHLQPHAPAAPAAPGYWWELPADGRPAGPQIVIGDGAAPLVAWDGQAAAAIAPDQSIAPAEPYWLALLGSQIGRRWLQHEPPASLPVPAAPAPARQHLGGLALRLAALGGERAGLERAVARRLLADFGPPGAQLGPRLGRWWALEFAQLQEALRGELGGDIPARFRAGWAQGHAEQRAAHAALGQQIGQAEAALDAQVAALYAA